MVKSHTTQRSGRANGVLRFAPDAPAEGPGSTTAVLFDHSGREIIRWPAVGDVSVEEDDRLGLEIGEHREGDIARVLDGFWPYTFDRVTIAEGRVGGHDLEAIGRHGVRALQLGWSGHDPSGLRHERILRLPHDPALFGALKDLWGIAVHTPEFGDEHLFSLPSPRSLQRLVLSGTGVTGAAIAAADLRRVDTLWLSDNEAISDDITFLTSLPELANLTLRSVGLRNRHLRAFEVCRGVSSLDIAYNPVGGASLEGLAVMPRLWDLDLSGTRTNDGTVGSLVAIPSLARLNLSTLSLTDEAVTHLGSLTGVDRLWLARSRITDDGLATLVCAMPQLRILDVSLTRITKRGVPHIMGLQKLWRLDISPAVLDHEIVEMLSGLPGLKEIDLRGPMDDLEIWGFIADTVGASKCMGID